jgi:hypothetical protein
MVQETLSQGNPTQKRAGGGAQGVGRVQTPVLKKKEKKRKKFGHQSLMLLGSGATFRRWGLVEGGEVTGEVPMKEILGPWILFSLLSSFLASIT